MNKKLIALITSLAINLVLLFINYHSYIESNYLKFSYRMYGGEIMIEYGFGWRVVHIYAMSMEDTNTHSLHFSPLSLLLTILFGIGLVWLLLSVIDKIRKR